MKRLPYLRELNESNKNISVLELAQAVLPIFQEKFPQDHTVSNAIQAVMDFRNDKITSYEMNQVRQKAFTYSIKPEYLQNMPTDSVEWLAYNCINGACYASVTSANITGAVDDAKKLLGKEINDKNKKNIEQALANF